MPYSSDARIAIGARQRLSPRAGVIPLRRARDGRWRGSVRLKENRGGEVGAPAPGVRRGAGASARLSGVTIAPSSRLASIQRSSAVAKSPALCFETRARRAPRGAKKQDGKLAPAPCRADAAPVRRRDLRGARIAASLIVRACGRRCKRKIARALFGTRAR